MQRERIWIRKLQKYIRNDVLRITFFIYTGRVNSNADKSRFRFVVIKEINMKKFFVFAISIIIFTGCQNSKTTKKKKDENRIICLYISPKLSSNNMESSILLEVCRQTLNKQDKIDEN